MDAAPRRRGTGRKGFLFFPAAILGLVFFSIPARAGLDCFRILRAPASPVHGESAGGPALSVPRPFLPPTNTHNRALLTRLGFIDESGRPTSPASTKDLNDRLDRVNDGQPTSERLEVGVRFYPAHEVSDDETRLRRWVGQPGSAGEWALASPEAIAVAAIWLSPEVLEKNRAYGFRLERLKPGVGRQRAIRAYLDEVQKTFEAVGRSVVGKDFAPVEEALLKFSHEPPDYALELAYQHRPRAIVAWGYRASPQGELLSAERRDYWRKRLGDEQEFPGAIPLSKRGLAELKREYLNSDPAETGPARVQRLAKLWSEIACYVDQRILAMGDTWITKEYRGQNGETVFIGKAGVALILSPDGRAFLVQRLSPEQARIYIEPPGTLLPWHFDYGHLRAPDDKKKLDGLIPLETLTVP